MKAHDGPSESAPLTAAKPMKPSSQGHPGLCPRQSCLRRRYLFYNTLKAKIACLLPYMIFRPQAMLTTGYKATDLLSAALQHICTYMHHKAHMHPEPQK